MANDRLLSWHVLMAELQLTPKKPAFEVVRDAQDRETARLINEEWGKCNPAYY